MFASNDFHAPLTAAPRAKDNRLLGLAILLIGVSVLAACSFFADQEVFLPFAPTYAITQTAAARASPTSRASSTRAPVAPPVRPRRTPTITPIPGEQVRAGEG
ncbi:MAG TPA: hypothetical protein VMT34_11130 [Aggregatilineales bacterium]|nr:hypothetical protein [Aggregatilineales bacterium]